MGGEKGHAEPFVTIFSFINHFKQNHQRGRAIMRNNGGSGGGGGGKSGLFFNSVYYSRWLVFIRLVSHSVHTVGAGN